MEQNTGIELMPLISRGDELLVDGRLLHSLLKVGSNFRHWIVGRIEEYNFEEGKDYFRSAVAPGAKNSQGSKTGPAKEIKNGMQIEYSISLDMAKELAMIERNDTGRQFRRYFIRKEKEARTMTNFIAAPTNMFKGLPKETINGHVLYLFTPLMKSLGYSAETADMRKKNYPNHFMKIGSRLYITESYANHLYKSSIIIKSRRAVKALQPVLSLDFGKPLQLDLQQKAL